MTALSPGEVASAISGGDLDFQVTFTAAQDFVVQFGGTPYIWSLSTPDGECSLRVTAGLGYGALILRVRGSDVLDVDGGVGATTLQGWQAGDTVTLRAWYKASSLPARSMGLRMTVNGATEPDQTGTAAGLPLSAATSGTFGTSSTGTLSLNASLVGTVAGAPGLVANLTPEFVELGDSTSNAASIASPMCGTIYDGFDRNTRPGILSFAKGGDTTAGQLAAFAASPYWGAAAIKAIVLQTGINDGPAISGYQTAVNAIKAGNPGALLLISKTIPWQANAAVIALDQAIAGLGPTPITGADAAVVSHYETLGGGGDTLLAQYLWEGGPHDNYAGRVVNGLAIREALVALGRLSTHPLCWHVTDASPLTLSTADAWISVVYGTDAAVIRIGAVTTSAPLCMTATDEAPTVTITPTDMVCPC
ncbi:MAG: hypothetical protein WBX26_10615 [Candidatus Cybelea sp.]